MMITSRKGNELFKVVRTFRPQVRFMPATGYRLSDLDEDVLKQMSSIARRRSALIQLVKAARNTPDDQLS